jgi:hypothetical protein
MRKIIALSFAMLVFSSFARHEQSSVPKKITLSYIDHPVAKSIMLPMFEDVYASLGIKTEFVLQPSLRNLVLASNGITDGDVAYADLLIKRHENLVAVGPSLFETHFMLICNAVVPCSADALLDPHNIVIMTEATLGGLKQKFTENLKANPFLINIISRIPHLIQNQKAMYGIYVTMDLDDSLDRFRDLNKVKLFSTPTHHILNKKHADLFPQISQGISEFMPAYLPTTVNQQN